MNNDQSTRYIAMKLAVEIHVHTPYADVASLFANAEAIAAFIEGDSDD